MTHRTHHPCTACFPCTCQQSGNRLLRAPVLRSSRALQCPALWPQSASGFTVSLYPATHGPLDRYCCNPSRSVWFPTHCLKINGHPDLAWAMWVSDLHRLITWARHRRRYEYSQLVPVRIAKSELRFSPVPRRLSLALPQSAIGIIVRPEI